MFFFIFVIRALRTQCVSTVSTSTRPHALKHIRCVCVSLWFIIQPVDLCREDVPEIPELLVPPGSMREFLHVPPLCVSVSVCKCVFSVCKTVVKHN